MQYLLALLNSLSMHFQLLLQTMAPLLVPKVLFIAVPLVGLAVLAFVAPQFTKNLFFRILDIPADISRIIRTVATGAIDFCRNCFNAVKSLLGFSSKSGNSGPRNSWPSNVGPSNSRYASPAYSSSPSRFSSGRFDEPVRHPVYRTSEPSLTRAYPLYRVPTRNWPSPPASPYRVPTSVPPARTEPVSVEPVRVEPPKTESLQEYIQRLEKMDPSYSKQFADKKLEVKDSDDEITCPVTLDIMEVPVRVKGENRHGFDYASLINLPTKYDGSREHPLTRKKFQLSDIEPAKDLEKKIKERLGIKRARAKI